MTHCFGCGREPSPKERRSLANPDAKDVVEVWKSLIKNLKEFTASELDKLVTGSGKMCRKCYVAFKTCYKHQQAITNNLAKAVEYLDVPDQSGTSTSTIQESAEPPPKRPRLVTNSARNPSANTHQQSPDVVV